MQLAHRMVVEGNWLFRFRSYLPVVFLPLVIAGISTQGGALAQTRSWGVFCLGVSLLGLAVRWATVAFVPAGTSGRNTRSQRALQLNRRGMYSIVRHPLYLGNFLVGCGMVLVPLNFYLMLIYVLAFWLYYERIMAAEEQFLLREFGTEFTEWAGTTPAFLPTYARWRRPELPCSVRTVLRREYTGLLVAVAMHAGLHVAQDSVAVGCLIIAPLWLAVVGCAAAIYFTLRTLKKRTGLLRVQGR